MRALADVLLGWGWALSGSDLDIESPAVVHVKRGTEEVVGKVVGKWNGVSPTTSSVPFTGVRLFRGHAAENLPGKPSWSSIATPCQPTNPELRRAAELRHSHVELLPDARPARRRAPHGGRRRHAWQIDRHGHARPSADPRRPRSDGRLRRHARRRQCRAVRAESLGGRRGTAGEWSASRLPCRADPVLDNLAPSPFIRQWPAVAWSRPVSIGPIFSTFARWQAAILGIEPDHFDCYDSLAQLEAAFRRFAESIPGDGLLVARHDCQSTRRVTAGLPCRVESFGFSADADWSAAERARRGSRAIPLRDSPVWPSVVRGRLPMPGRHNVLNALAAAALACAEQAVAASRFRPAWAAFRACTGGWNRWDDGAASTLIDDYAHHPTEVTAALAAVRRWPPHARLWCVFQPHQASRTARLLDELAASLQNADKVLVAEIFRAREGDPQPGEVTAADLARRAAELGVEVLPGHAAQRDRRNAGNPVGPRRRIGYSRGWRLGNCGRLRDERTCRGRRPGRLSRCRHLISFRHD